MPGRFSRDDYGHHPPVLERLSEAVARPCPIALYPATTEREKIRFNQLNKETGNRIRYRKVDAETGVAACLWASR